MAGCRRNALAKIEALEALVEEWSSRYEKAVVQRDEMMQRMEPTR